MADSEQTGDATSTPVQGNVGDTLRTARTALDLTVEQLATELRIEARQLAALEDNRFEQIGVPVFVKGYLRQYGQRLGLAYGDLLALYYKQVAPADIEIRPSRTIKLRDDRQIRSWIVSAVVLLAILTGLAVWWFNGGRFDITSIRGAGASIGPAESSPAAAPVRNEPSPPIATPTPAPIPITPPVPSPVAVEVPVAADNSTEAADEPTVAPDEGGTPAEQADASAGVALDLTFEDESWAEIVDGRGERLFYGLAAAGRHAVVHGDPPFSIVLGNADVVRMLVDGNEYRVPTEGRQGKLARFSVDIAGE